MTGREQTERKFGITALRWAAHKAGLGIIRRNNFFYTDSGSWVYIEAWLIDKEIELKQKYTQKPCPPKCNRCIDACPTKSLRESYTMSRATCISCLTTWDGDDLINEPNNRLMGAWVFGCDVCQDVCPYNKRKWEAVEEYPDLNELSKMISLNQMTKDIITKISDLQVESILDTADLLDTQALEQAADMLMEANHIALFGISPNNLLGELYRRKMESIGRLVYISTVDEGGLLSSSLTSEDCASLIFIPEIIISGRTSIVC